MYKLHIRDDEGRSTVVPILRDEITVGRKEGNTIRLTERNVSRRHARLLRKNGRLLIDDLSRYGTRINGRRITESIGLEVGDLIQIGDYELSLDLEADAATLDAATAVEPGDAAGAAVQENSTALVNIGQMGLEDGAAADKGTPRLVILSGKGAGTEHAVSKDEIIIGRTPDNDVAIDHRSISRRHAKIKRDSGHYTIEDTGSSNGIKVNGEDYKQTILRRGDVIDFGHVKVRFVAPGETFVYDPSLHAEAAGGGNKLPLIIFLLLLLIAGGGAAAWFGYFSKAPGDGPAVAAESIGASPKAVKAAEGEPEVAAPEKAPEAAGDNEVKALLIQADGHMIAQRWDEAVGAYSKVLAVEGDNPEAKSGMERASAEKEAGKLYNGLNDKLQKGQVDAAWAQIGELDEIEPSSAYHSFAMELKKGITAAHVTNLLEQGEGELRSRRYAQARSTAEQALQADPGNEAASTLRDRAKRKLKDDAVAASKDKPKPPPRDPPKDKPKPPADDKPVAAESGQSAKDIYKAAGQAKKAGNLGEALSLYTKAAGKGYSHAWRQMGSIYAQQGKNGDAVKAWKKYLTISPGAKDAEVIRNAIQRYGGTPP